MGDPFRKRASVAKLSPEAAARQGRATKLAWLRMREPGAAIHFLNAHHAGLGGRPLDLAIQSAEGLRAVENAIASWDA